MNPDHALDSPYILPYWAQNLYQTWGRRRVVSKEGRAKSGAWERGKQFYGFKGGPKQAIQIWGKEIDGFHNRIKAWLQAQQNES